MKLFIRSVGPVKEVPPLTLVMVGAASPFGTAKNKSMGEATSCPLTLATKNSVPPLRMTFGLVPGPPVASAPTCSTVGSVAPGGAGAICAYAGNANDAATTIAARAALLIVEFITVPVSAASPRRLLAINYLLPPVIYGCFLKVVKTHLRKGRRLKGPRKQLAFDLIADPERRGVEQLHALRQRSEEIDASRPRRQRARR